MQTMQRLISNGKIWEPVKEFIYDTFEKEFRAGNREFRKEKQYDRLEAKI